MIRSTELGLALRDLLERIAATPIWRDKYPDGPDLMDVHFEVSPEDVRVVREIVAIINNNTED